MSGHHVTSRCGRSGRPLIGDLNRSAYMASTVLISLGTQREQTPVGVARWMITHPHPPGQARESVQPHQTQVRSPAEPTGSSEPPGCALRFLLRFSVFIRQWPAVAEPAR
jgi:hypothetical protein